MWDEIVAYRPYSSSVFFFLGFGLLVFRWKRVGVVAWGVFVVYLGAASFWMNLIWKDETNLWQHSVDHGGNARAHYNPAQSLPDGDPEKRSHYDESLARDPNYVVGHIGLGLMLVRIGVRENDAEKKDKGVQRLRHAVALDKTIAQSHYWMAQGLSYAGRKKEAVEPAVEAARLDQQNLDYQYFAAWLLVEVDRFRDALVYLPSIQKRYPDFKSTVYLMAKAHQSLKEYGDALTYLKRYLAKNPNHREVHLHLAECYRAMGDTTHAPEHQAIYDGKRQ